MLSWRALLILPLLVATAARAQTTGLQSDVIFPDYTPLSESRELLRRELTPVAYAQIGPSLANMPAQSIDLADERFLVYVPSSPPPAAGYELMVFVPPWDHARLPDEWSSVLDDHHMIFVTASRSGNDQNVITRREPLALLAEANIARHYPLDPARIYVAGMSGGSRVAMRLALAYPDVFTGAFLNAGSDPIGTASIPIPPADLFRRFQENTRLYYATGAQDLSNLELDGQSIVSMRSFCDFHTEREIMRNLGHAVAPPRVLENGLTYLETPPAADAEGLSFCRAELAKDLNGKLQEIRSDIASGKHDDAQKMLIDVNNRFGGLASDGIAGLSPP
ncbi:MAG: PHB depolymerase family esterase [Rhizomicrobium sp.]